MSTNVICFLALLMVIAVAGCAADSTGGTTYYVSPTGSDSSSGRTPATAWRTVAQANRADLHPGDTVLFEGGRSYTDDALMPEHSGSSGAPISYGSFGGGRARLTDGVWFTDKSDLVFSGLTIAGPEQGVNGEGNRITVENSRITDSGIAINAKGSGWNIRRNVVARTADSGMIIEGRGHDIEFNKVTDTGRDRSIPYARHGIYLKASASRVTRNSIRRFSSEGVSSRLPDAVVADNRISGGQVGIAWYQTAARSGTSRWRGNHISHVAQAGLYVSGADAAGPTTERFVISGNVVRTGARFMNLDTSPARTRVNCNVLLGGKGHQKVCSARAARAASRLR